MDPNNNTAAGENKSKPKFSLNMAGLGAAKADPLGLKPQNSGRG